jgi:hypothetical protein
MAENPLEAVCPTADVGRYYQRMLAKLGEERFLAWLGRRYDDPATVYEYMAYYQAHPEEATQES